MSTPDTVISTVGTVLTTIGQPLEVEAGAAVVLSFTVTVQATTTASVMWCYLNDSAGEIHLGGSSSYGVAPSEIIASKLIALPQDTTFKLECQDGFGYSQDWVLSDVDVTILTLVD